MKAEQFVSELHALTGAVINGLLEQMANPEGRSRARDELWLLSEWYQSQSAEDRERVALAVRRAAEGTLFTVLGVIDGTVRLPCTAMGSLELLYVENDLRKRLNDPEGAYLADVLSLAEPLGE